MERKRKCTSSHFPFQAQIKGFHSTGVMSILGTLCFPWALLVQEVVFCTKSSGQKLSILFLPPTFCKKKKKKKTTKKNRDKRRNSKNDTCAPTPDSLWKGKSFNNKSKLKKVLNSSSGNLHGTFTFPWATDRLQKRRWMQEQHQPSEAKPQQRPSTMVPFRKSCLHQKPISKDISRRQPVWRTLKEHQFPQGGCSLNPLLIITLLPEQLSCELILGYVRIWWFLASRDTYVQKVSLKVKSQGIPGHNGSCFFPPRRLPTQNCTHFGFEVEFGQSKLVKRFAFSFRIKLPWMSLVSSGHVLPWYPVLLLCNSLSIWAAKD